MVQTCCRSLQAPEELLAACDQDDKRVMGLGSGHLMPGAVSAVRSEAVALQEDVAHHVASFMLQDLRRFQMFDSSATRPYTVSAMACWKRASDLGYITLNKDKKVSSTGLLSLAWRGCCLSQL